MDCTMHLRTLHSQGYASPTAIQHSPTGTDVLLIFNGRLSRTIWISCVSCMSVIMQLCCAYAASTRLRSDNNADCFRRIPRYLRAHEFALRAALQLFLRAHKSSPPPTAAQSIADTQFAVLGFYNPPLHIQHEVLHCFQQQGCLPCCLQRSISQSPGCRQVPGISEWSEPDACSVRCLLPAGGAHRPCHACIELPRRLHCDVLHRHDAAFWLSHNIMGHDPV
jgi:hypothetical protein